MGEADPGLVDPFHDLLIDLAQGLCVVLRFDHVVDDLEFQAARTEVLQDTVDPGKFVLYEAYESESAAVAHKQTSHYAAWRDAVASWMEKPREGVKHNMLFPSNALAK